MSDNTRALPAPGDVGPAGAAPARRSFKPQLTSRYRKDGMSEGDALARLAERRAARHAAAPQQPAPQAPPARPHPPQMAPPAPAPQPHPEAPQGHAYSPLTTLLGEAPAQTNGAAPPAQAVTDPVFDFTIGGEPVQVALSELVRGYMRYADYTRKTAETAAQLKQAQDQHREFTQARQRLEGALPAVLGSIGNEFDQPIDWVRLAQTDPIGYAAKDARFKVWQAAKQEAANMAQLKANEDYQQKKQMQAWGHEFLCQTLPGWRDPLARREIQTQINQYLRDVGFQQAEIDKSELLDPRHIIILEEGRRFRQIVAQDPDLLRNTFQVRPDIPARRGEAPQTFGGNGTFSRAPASEQQVTSAQKRWDDLDNRSGAGARDAAIDLIGARRAARMAMGAAPLPRRRLPN
jgi:hypothetical protein